jgi:hypothetical protein
VAHEGAHQGAEEKKFQDPGPQLRPKKHGRGRGVGGRPGPPK